jgi:DNA invertase Pin-like site-specific DNA recombinase
MAGTDTNAPQDELARAEAALAELERKTREARIHVQALRARKTALHESPPPYATPPSPQRHRAA